MTSNHEAETLASGYSEFLRAAKEVEGIILSLPDTSAVDLADGYLYLAGMWNFHVERAFKGYDVDRPCFIRDMDPFRTWGFPTPDHHYLSAQICGDGEYRITGSRGNTVDYCFEVLSGLAGDDGVIGDRIDALEAGNMDIGPDGRYEVFVGGEPRPRNWLKASANARVVFVRQTANDWNSEQATPMLIERIDGDIAPCSRPSAEQVSRLFRQAAHNLVCQVKFLHAFAQNWGQVLPLNDLPEATVGPADAGYFPGQLNTKCRWQLKPDEALLITLRPTPVRYQSLTLAHPLWFNNIQPRNIQSSLTGAQSRLSSDDYYHYVVSASDPGVHNWLDTGGLDRGFLFLRFQRANGIRLIPKPAVRVVKVADLRAHLPQDEPVVTPADRAAILRKRRLASDRRFA